MENINFRIGDKVIIIDGGVGARGCNGCEGIITNEDSNHGHVGSKQIKIKITKVSNDRGIAKANIDDVWEVPIKECKLEVINYCNDKSFILRNLSNEELLEELKTRL